jgi:hypothetical protein
MGRISPAIVMRAVGIFAWLVVGAMALPAAAQQPLPPLPAPSVADLAPPQQTVPPTAGVPAGYAAAAEPSDYAGAASSPMDPVVVTGLFDTVAESILGEPDPDTWRPLSLSTLFSEGWNEAWVPSPNGSGGAPRQGWINAADGNFYRLWFFTFAQAFNQGNKSNAYLGAYTLYTPLSRRLLLIANIPFVERNGVASGLPITGGPSGLNTPRTVTRNQTTFGDLTFTPRVMLHETQDFSLTSELAVTVPTGNQPLAGKTVLTPAVGFWNNFAGRWVIRGAIGDLIPLGGGGHDTLISQLAIGCALTDHDVRLFGDFTLYVSAVADTPLADGQRTSVTLTPGMRTHLGRDWYFLAGLPTPLTSARVGDIGMIFWFMKAW